MFAMPRQKARELHLVLGASTNRKPIRFRLTIDGYAPGADIKADGSGTITEQRRPAFG